MTEVFKGATDQTFYFKMVDSAAGTPETGLTITNIDATYTRNREAAVKNDLTALAATTTAHTDNKGIEIDATNAPGLYRVDFPDAAFATGVDKVILTVTCSGCDPAMKEIILTNINNQVAYVPNAAADAAGGLPISDAGALDLDARLDAAVSSRMASYTQPTGFLAATFPNGTIANTTNITAGTITTVTTVTNQLTAAQIATGVWTDTTAGDFTTALSVGKSVMNGVTLGTGLTVAAVAGAVGSVTGAVGSVAAGGITAASFAANAITAAKLDPDVTTELQAGLATQASVDDLPTNTELATALGTADDAVLSAIAALNNLSAAQVNAEVVDALATDTYAEPTGVPAATDDLATKIGYIYMALRNRVDVTATKKQFYDDGGSVEWEKDLSDDGVTYTETEANAP